MLKCPYEFWRILYEHVDVRNLGSHTYFLRRNPAIAYDRYFLSINLIKMLIYFIGIKRLISRFHTNQGIKLSVPPLRPSPVYLKKKKEYIWGGTLYLINTLCLNQRSGNFFNHYPKIFFVYKIYKQLTLIIEGKVGNVKRRVSDCSKDRPLNKFR
jgi:hypothetical protein